MVNMKNKMPRQWAQAAMVCRSSGPRPQCSAAAVGPDRNVLSQQLAQTAALCGVHSVLAQAIVVLIIPLMTHELEATTDEQDNLDLSHVAPSRAEGWSPQFCQTPTSSS